jgi:hypothetical protein
MEFKNKRLKIPIYKKPNNSKLGFSSLLSTSRLSRKIKTLNSSETKSSNTTHKLEILYKKIQCFNHSLTPKTGYKTARQSIVADDFIIRSPYKLSSPISSPKSINSYSQ